MLMTWAEEQENVAAYALYDSQEAFDKILYFFLPLIRSIAKRILWNRSDYDDLMQLGTFALSQAIRKYDSSRGNRLAPFAEKLIRSEMTRYRRANFGPVRIGAASKIWKAYRRLPKAIEERGRLGRDPFDASAIDHYADLFALDLVTVKSLLATHRAGAHAAVPITGAEWEYTEAAHQELWFDGGQSQVERRLDDGTLMRSVVCRVGPQVAVGERALEAVPPERLRLLAATQRFQRLQADILPGQRNPQAVAEFDPAAERDAGRKAITVKELCASAMAETRASRVPAMDESSRRAARSILEELQVIDQDPPAPQVLLADHLLGRGAILQVAAVGPSDRQRECAPAVAGAARPLPTPQLPLSGRGESANTNALPARRNRAAMLWWGCGKREEAPEGFSGASRKRLLSLALFGCGGRI